jgi:hypothetical protein
MCTTGVLRLGPADYLLFKNKDFGRSHFDDRLVVERDVFGIQGITTWAGDDPETDQFSGFSIGANRYGLLCCDSNVRTVPDHENYDRLVEIALRAGTDVPSAIDAVARAVADQPYLWANLVMIDSNMTAAIEVRGTEIETSFGTERRSRSNHHVSLGPSPDDDDQLTTVARYESARRRVEDVITLDDVLALQASHDSGPTGICNHLGYHTVYTYVERWHEGTVTLYVGQGQPCETGDPMVLDIPLDSAWSAEAEGTFRDAYPSAKSLAIA